MKILLGFILCVPFLIWGSVRTYKGIDYNRHIGGHLKRAADANTVALASKELDAALSEIERRGLTSGYTNVLWTTPDCDVGFWHDNIQASAEELRKVNEETTELERTNMLMKLRETLVDHGEKGVNVTEPTGISIYPNNVAYAWCGWFSLVVACIGCLVIFVALSDL